MSVITRNQSKMIASQEKLIIPHNAINVNQSNKRVWFFNAMKKALDSLKQINNEKNAIICFMDDHYNKAYSSISLNTHLKDKYRTIHFDKIRHITEILFMVKEYLPEIHDMSLSINKFTEVVYTKIYKFYEEIRVSDINPETEDEHKVINCFIGVLEDVEKTIIPLLSNDIQLKRRLNHRTAKLMNYTRMNTI